MNVIIIGDGAEELAWARAVIGRAGFKLARACPGFKELPIVPASADLDEALATRDLDLVIAGGDPELRAEAIRRSAAEGLVVLALHPPGPNADPYYQVTLSRLETDAVVIPAIPGRLHPAVERLAAELRRAPESAVRFEVCRRPEKDGDLLGVEFAVAIDQVRALIGEVVSVTATTREPAGQAPRELLVQVRGETTSAELRLSQAPNDSSRLTVYGPAAAFTLERDESDLGRARFIDRTADAEPAIETLEPWEPCAAMLELAARARSGDEIRPNLQDGIRAMEITEAVAKSLRKKRTIDLVYEEMSESSNFKSIMTSVGCGLLVMAVLLLILAAIAVSLEFSVAAYAAWVVLPALVAFVLLQLLGLGVKRPKTGPGATKRAD